VFDNEVDVQSGDYSHHSLIFRLSFGENYRLMVIGVYMMVTFADLKKFME